MNMNSATPTNLKKTILLSFLSIGIMFLLYGLTESGYFGDNPVGQGSNFNVPSIVPQPYAFAIWGLIYTGLVVFPIYQWFKRQEGNPLWKKVHVWLAINAVLNGLWLAMASLDWLVITVVIMLLMLVTLYQINNLLRTINMESGDLSYWPEKFVFSIYFAWITLATALNITAALVYYNWSGFGIGDIPWSIAILCVASLIAAITFWKYKDVAYAGVVIWAFIALVVKHIDKLPVLAYLSITVVAIFVLLIVLGIRTSTAA